VDLCEAANGRQVFRRTFQDVLERTPRLFQPAEVNEGAAQRDVSRQIRGMADKAGVAGFDRFIEAAGAAVLLGKSGERDGRRIRLDPASQFFNAWRVRHRVTGYCTATVFVTRPVFPALSVTVSVTL
jgi:hypothetical protein